MESSADGSFPSHRLLEFFFQLQLSATQVSSTRPRNGAGNAGSRVSQKVDADSQSSKLTEAFSVDHQHIHNQLEPLDDARTLRLVARLFGDMRGWTR